MYCTYMYAVKYTALMHFTVYSWTYVQAYQKAVSIDSIVLFAFTVLPQKVTWGYTFKLGTHRPVADACLVS